MLQEMIITMQTDLIDFLDLIIEVENCQTEIDLQLLLSEKYLN